MWTLCSISIWMNGMMLIQRFPISWPFQHPPIQCKFRHPWIEYCDTWYLTDTDALNPCLWKCARIPPTNRSCMPLYMLSVQIDTHSERAYHGEKNGIRQGLNRLLPCETRLVDDDDSISTNDTGFNKGLLFLFDGRLVGVESKRMEVLYNFLFIFRKDILFTRVL